MVRPIDGSNRTGHITPPIQGKKDKNLSKDQLVRAPTQKHTPQTKILTVKQVDSNNVTDQLVDKVDHEIEDTIKSAKHFLKNLDQADKKEFRKAIRQTIAELISEGSKNISKDLQDKAKVDAALKNFRSKVLTLIGMPVKTASPALRPTAYVFKSGILEESTGKTDEGIRLGVLKSGTGKAVKTSHAIEGTAFAASLLKFGSATVTGAFLASTWKLVKEARKQLNIIEEKLKVLPKNLTQEQKALKSKYETQIKNLKNFIASQKAVLKEAGLPLTLSFASTLLGMTKYSMAFVLTHYKLAKPLLKKLSFAKKGLLIAGDSLKFIISAVEMNKSVKANVLQEKWAKEFKQSIVYEKRSIQEHLNKQKKLFLEKKNNFLSFINTLDDKTSLKDIKPQLAKYGLENEKSLGEIKKNKDIFATQFAKRQETLNVTLRNALQTAAVQKQKVENRFFKFSMNKTITSLIFAGIGLLLSLAAVIFFPASLPLFLTLAWVGMFVAGTTLWAAGQIHQSKNKPKAFKQSWTLGAFKNYFRNISKAYKSWRLAKRSLEKQKRQNKVDSISQKQILFQKSDDEMLRSLGYDPKMKSDYLAKIKKKQIDAQKKLDRSIERLNQRQVDLAKLEGRMKTYQDNLRKGAWIDYHGMMNKEHKMTSYQSLLEELPATLKDLVTKDGLDQDTLTFLKEKMNINLPLINSLHKTLPEQFPMKVADFHKNPQLTMGLLRFLRDGLKIDFKDKERIITKQEVQNVLDDYLGEKASNQIKDFISQTNTQLASFLKKRNKKVA